MPDHIPTVFDFSAALVRLKAGQPVTRLCWRGDGRHLHIMRQSNGWGMVMLRQWHGSARGYWASSEDLLAEDWAGGDGAGGRVSRGGTK